MRVEKDEGLARQRRQADRGLAGAAGDSAGTIASSGSRRTRSHARLQLSIAQQPIQSPFAQGHDLFAGVSCG